VSVLLEQQNILRLAKEGKRKMNVLKKANLDRLFKKVIVKSEDVTIANTFQERCDIISELFTFFSGNDFKDYFKFEINKQNLENEIASCKKDYNERQTSRYYSYPSQTEQEYIHDKLYSNYYGLHVETYLLEKYKPTQAKSDEVFLCELNFRSSVKSRILFAFYFNEISQLCFDYIAIRGKKWRSNVSIDKDITILTEITGLEAIKNMLCAFPEEEAESENEEKQREIENDKNRIKKEKIKDLSSKVVRSRIKTLLNEKNIPYSVIDERVHMIKLYLNMKKGKTMIRIPKKDILNRLDIIPDLCEKIIEADQHNIQCKYVQNM